MFLAYHIRSSFLTCEMAFNEELMGLDISIDDFYVLRCDWQQVETPLAELSVHAMKTKRETIHVLDKLMAKAYVMKGTKDDYFILSPRGAALRTQVLQKYREHFSKTVERLSKEVIETTLSTLLTLQKNIQTS